MDNCGFLAETDDPTEENRRYCHPGGEDKMIFPIGNQKNIPAKPIDNHIDEATVEPHFYICCITGIHLKQPIGMVGQILTGQLRAGDPQIIQKFDVSHTVHPIGGDTVAGGKGQ